MKEFVMQEIEEMTTFGSARKRYESVWKRYKPVAELVRCKDCKLYDERISLCDNCGLPREQTFFCKDGEQK